MIGLLRTILIILAVYYGFKLVSRYVIPFLLRRFINKMQDKVRQQHENQQQDTNVNVGETVIDKKPKNGNKSNNSVGEYIDYEDIE